MSEQEFREAFSDEKFVQELLSLKTGEQVRSALLKKGIVLTAEEMDRFAEILVNSLEKSRLSEEKLGSLSGGVIYNTDNNAELSDDITFGAKFLADCTSLEKVKELNGYFANSMNGNK